MSEQEDFHNQLEAIFPGLNLYYRPPTNLLLEYPCIVYDVKNFNASRANNAVYVNGTTFRATVMSVLPGYEDTRNMLQLAHSEHINSFISDGIVHEVFDISLRNV